jgi:hypothetical protein
MKRKLILTAIFCAILLSLVSCRQAKEITKYDTVYVSKTEYKERLKTDSVFVHDSVFVTKKGDTVYMYKYKDKYIVKIRYDTINATDTLYQYKEVVKEEQKVKNGPLKFVLFLIGAGCFTALSVFVYEKIKGSGF